MRMKIDVAGGGPSGLYFAYLMKKTFPDARIRVIEQNPPDATYGFGVVFSGRALSILEDADPAVIGELTRKVELWSDQHIVHRNERVVIDGNSFSGVERLIMLQVLQRLCEAQGVELRFNQRLEGEAAEQCDVLVAADGANSAIRDAYAEAFQTEVVDLANHFAWYGVDLPYEAHTLTFIDTDTGVYCGHHYRYTPERSTFVAEVDAATWRRAGMDAMDDDQRRRLTEEIFAETLQGKPLITNRSVWRRYRIVKNGRWHHRNMVLIGDAQRTAHPSIGSGTRLAMEDAVALWRGFQAHGSDIEAAFRHYEHTRRPGRDRLNRAAEKSIAWYENMASKMHLEPLDLAYDYLLRTGVVTPEHLRRNSPAFMAQYQASHGLDADATFTTSATSR